MKDKKEKTNTDENQSEAVVVKRKVIYVEIDDEVTAVYDRIRTIKGGKVYIVVPTRAILFQSVVNLQILRRKAEDDGKEIAFITNDPNGIYLAQKIGLEVFNKANPDGKPAIFSTDKKDDNQLKITPLKASVNAVEEETPTRLAERKLSIADMLKRGGKNAKEVEVRKVDEKAVNKKKKERNKLILVAPNRHALIGLIVGTVLMLSIIFYIALPGVTVYLTPTASVLEESVNITLADATRNRAELETNPKHMIASYPIDTEITESITHSATGKRFSEQGANSSGIITVVNTTGNDWPLVDQTRFQTNDGAVFRIQQAVTVPAATSEGPGKLDTYVVADQEDADGIILGERGNIGPSRFFLPGLSESSRSKIYAESSEPMTGGLTDYVTYITEEDLNAARIRIAEQMNDLATDSLREMVSKESDRLGVEMKLLEGDGAVKIGEPVINAPDDLVGREIKEFTVSGSVQVVGVYYNYEEMLEILANELALYKSPQKELLRVNEDSTSYRIFEWDGAAGKIKLTANIKGIEQFSIDPDKDSGARLLEKISNHIAGQSIEDAQLYIQNLPEINKAEIDSWPAWSPTIPSIADNIKFEIRESVSVE